MSEKKRLDYLDIAKGMAILLVILGHCCVSFDSERGIGMIVNPWLKTIYSFHMPLFFVAAGVVSRPRNDVSWGTALRKDFFALLVPYAIFALIYMPFSLTNVGRMLYGTTQAIKGSGQVCTHLWFLPCLFVARQLMFLILSFSAKVRREKAVCVVSAFAVFAVGLLLPKLKFGYPLSCNTALVALGFMLVGYLIREKLAEFDGKGVLFQVALVIVSAAVLGFGNVYGMNEPGFVGMYISNYGPRFWFFANAFAGIVMVRALASVIAKIDLDSGIAVLRKTLTWIGRNTLWIFLLHMPINVLYVMPWMERAFSLQRGRLADSILMTLVNLALSVAGTILIGGCMKARQSGRAAKCAELARKAVCLFVAAFALQGGICLADGVAAPDEAKPRCWWWWFGDTVTTNGITHDLEAMKDLGLGGASICANSWFGFGDGPVKCLSKEWYDCVAWAGREADRLGLTLGFHNCPGWCNTGGPWVRPEFAQKHLVWTEQRLDGGKAVDCTLPKAGAPFGIYRPVAVVAIPDRENAETFEGGSGVCVFAAPRIVSGLIVSLSDFTFGRNFVDAPEYVISVSDDGVAYREHWRTSETRAETFHALTFPAVRAKAVKLTVAKGELPKILRMTALSVPRIPHYLRKSYASFIWMWPLVPQETFECPQDGVIGLDEVVDLTDRVTADGRLVWQAPPGKWIVLNFASTVMDYAVNHVATPSGTGLECDKLSAAGVEEGARGPVSRIPELARRLGIKSFRTVHIDSSEAPAQNWTERMPEEFRALRGYDLRKFLPVMTGRYVGSSSVSERFLRDFRRTVGDLMVRYWGGHYASIMHRNGLEFEFQAYNWPFNQLEMAQYADVPMGEFWVHTGFGANDATKLAAEQGDVYGRRIVSCEAFTDACGKVMTDDNEQVDDLRREGDRRFANGINRFVIHAYTHQPYDDPALRTNYWHFGIRIDRHHPKFASLKPWVAYLTETQAKLQVGRGVADAVVLTREDVTLDLDDWLIKDPFGYRSNAIERTLFLSALEFRDGRLRLPSGMEYRLLVLPDVDALSPEVLRKARQLAEAGAEVLLGRRPVESPSLTGYPACDDEVRRMAKGLWDACPEGGQARIGKGRIWRGVKPLEIYRAIGLAPDFAATENGKAVTSDEVVYTHRTCATFERYFIANVTEQAKTLQVRLRSGLTKTIRLEASTSCFVDETKGCVR